MQSIPIPIVVMALLLTQARSVQTIIGKWEALEPAAGGFFVTMEFGPRGVFYHTAGISRSGTYRLDGSRILIEEGVSNSDSDAMEFRVESDKLVSKGADGEVAWPRIGRSTPNSPPIVGKWGAKGAFFHGGENGAATFEFTQDGHFKFRMQAEPEKGRYQTRGKLLITKASGESTIYSFRFEDGFLILKSDSIREERYRRIER